MFILFDLGGTVITIWGRDYSKNPRATVDGKACSLVSKDSTKITCKTPEGTGPDRNVVVSVEGVDSNSTLFHYDPPVITEIAVQKQSSMGGYIVFLKGITV